MKITLAQLNFHVGSFEDNFNLIIDAINKAKNQKSDIIVFSELALTGYPPLDLLEHRDFIEKCESYMKQIAGKCTDIAAIIGAPAINKDDKGKKLFNAAYFLANGKIKEKIFKSLLPTYDIFDEYRYFEPSDKLKLISFKGKKLAVTICEDLWDEQGFDNDFSSSRMYRHSPMEELSKMKPDLIINLSASPFSARRIKAKRNIFIDKAKKYQLPLFMVNQVGANTELIFEGNSMVISPDGNVFDLLPSFREEQRSYVLNDVIKGSANPENLPDENSHELINMIHSALVTGVRDFFKKLNFSSAVLGLSGGIDSAVCLCIAAEAIGAENIRVLLLPSMYSSQHSIDDAVLLAEKLKVEYDIINIEDSFHSIEKSLHDIMEGLPEDVTEENIQSRLRGLLLMAVSNKLGNILLNTSNKSEAAVGYGTLYGDMAGSLSVIGDVYKTDVYKLARYINRENEIIPENTISKAPSAELRPNQKDLDSLPDYEVLDSILYQYIELQRPINKISGRNISPELVNRILLLINQTEYKRFQSPPILRISSKAFGSGRRMPLVARY